MLFEMLMPLTPLALMKIPRAASFERPYAPPNPIPLFGSVGLSPSILNPLKFTLETVIVAIAPLEVFVVAGIIMASATLTPLLGEMAAFGPLIVIDLFITIFSGKVSAVTEITCPFNVSASSIAA